MTGGAAVSRAQFHDQFQNGEFGKKWAVDLDDE